MRKILLFVLAAVLMASCKTKYVTVEKVHDVYHSSIDTLHDSTYQYIYITEHIKGDTVFRDKTEYKYRDRWRTHDSIVIQRDSIPVIVEKEKIVKASLPWYYRILLWAAGIVLAGVAGLMLWRKIFT